MRRNWTNLLLTVGMEAIIFLLLGTILWFLVTSVYGEVGDILQQDGEVVLQQYGEIYSSDEGFIPLYKVVIGDTTLADKWHGTYYNLFGVFALNGTIYVRVEGTWKAVTYTTPTYGKEPYSEEWYEDIRKWQRAIIEQNYLPADFYSEREISIEELPIVPAVTRDAILMGYVDFILEYALGGVVVYCKDYSSLQEATQLYNFIVEAQ